MHFFTAHATRSDEVARDSVAAAAAKTWFTAAVIDAVRNFGCDTAVGEVMDKVQEEVRRVSGGRHAVEVQDTLTGASVPAPLSSRR